MDKDKLLALFAHRQADLDEFLDIYGDYESYGLDDIAYFFEVDLDSLD